MSADKNLKVFLDDKEDIFMFDGNQSAEESKEVEKIWEAVDDD